MKQLTPSHHHGFTLTECLIVLFLLCCIATFTVPTVRELWVRQQAESYMQQLRQALNLARVKAVSENHDDGLVLVVSSAEHPCSVRNMQKLS